MAMGQMCEISQLKISPWPWLKFLHESHPKRRPGGHTGTILGPWEYHGNIMGISWEYHGNIIRILWVYNGSIRRDHEDTLGI